MKLSLRMIKLLFSPAASLDAAALPVVAAEDFLAAAALLFASTISFSGALLLTNYRLSEFSFV